MKRIYTLTVIGLATSLSACIVVPHRPYVHSTDVNTIITTASAPVPAAVNVVYVAPSYPQPAIGYHWVHNPYWGWGWRHQHHGWHHRGYRR